MKKDIVLVGAGGLGREVLWLLEEINNITDEWNILGFIDDNTVLQGKTVNDYPVLGTCQWLIDYSKPISVLCCVGQPYVRMQIVEKLQVNTNIFFPSIIARDVRYSKNVKFGKGCIVFPSSILTVDVSIGDFVIVSIDCIVSHDSTLDPFVTLYPSVNISGNVYIGSATEVGVGSNVIQGKKIGYSAVIGAGAVVVKDIPDNCLAVGSPARVIKWLDKHGR